MNKKKLNSSILMSTILFLSITALLKAQDYYPLQKGFVWTYQHYDTKGIPIDWEEKIIVDAFNPREELYLVREVSKMGDAAPIITLLEIDKRKNYILFTAYKGGLLDAPWTDNIETVLKLPLVVGSSWTRFNHPEKVIKDKVINKINLQIGNNHYSDVFVIQEVFSFPQSPKSKTITYYYYYAPGVGLIRQEADVNGRRWLMKDLISFEY